MERRKLVEPWKQAYEVNCYLFLFRWENRDLPPTYTSYYSPGSPVDFTTTDFSAWHCPHQKVLIIYATCSLSQLTHNPYQHHNPILVFCIPVSDDSIPLLVILSPSLYLTCMLQSSTYRVCSSSKHILFSHSSHPLHISEESPSLLKLTHKWSVSLYLVYQYHKYKRDLKA